MTKNTIKHYFPHPMANAIFILFAVIYWQSADIFLRHHDIGWHIAAGQQIRQLGAISEYDSWSFTAGNTKWLNISWFWDVAASKIYELGGFYPLVAGTILLGALICSLLTCICIKLKASSLLTLFGVLVVGLTFPFYQPPWDYVLSISPQTISLIFFLIFYAIILHILQVKNTKIGWLMPALMVLWVNMHGAFFLGLMLIGFAFLTAFYEKKKTEAKYFFILGIACTISVFINPLGIHIIDAILRSLTATGNATITEWQPFAFGTDLLSTIYVMFFIVVVNWRNKNIPIFCRIIALICLFSGLLQKRNFVYFLFTSLPVLLLSIQPYIMQLKNIAEYIVDIEKDMTKPQAAKISTILAILMACAVVSPSSLQLRFPDGITLPKEFYPEEEIAYLRTRITSDTPEPIFNSWNFGGYLIFSLRDKVKVYIDGRADTVYPDSIISIPLLKRYETLEETKSIRFAITPNYQPISQLYFIKNPNWKTAFVGKVATIFERNQ